jgi:hypothetical protein
MASRKVDIQISTKADTTGAKDTTQAIDKMVDKVDEAEVAVVDLSQAVDKLDGKLDEVDNSTKVVDRAVDNLTDSVVKLDDRVTDTAQATDKLDDALHVVETSGKGAARSIDAVSQASDKAATSTAKAGKGTASIGVIAQSAGYQVQDFAVQVAGGTSALVAMSQQAPQFLGVFGPGGAIAGALIAVGAIAVKVFMGMADDSANAAEKAALLAEAVEQIGENAAKAVDENIDFGLSQIVLAAEQAENLIGAYQRVTDAQNASTAAALSNTEKLREAELDLARLRGESVDEVKAISDNVAADAAAREEQARQQIAAQNEQLSQAQQQEAIAQELFLATQSQAIQTELSRQAETRKLEVLRAQRDELQKQASERGKLSEGEIPFAKTGGAIEAQRQLDDPAFQALIAATEARVNALDAQLSANGGKIAEAVATTAQGLNDAMANAATVAESIAIEIPKIEQTLQAETIKAEVAGLVETGKQAADEIKLIAESARPENSGQVAAVEALKGAVADGVIAASETSKVAIALQTLNGSINTSIGGVNTNVTQLIQLMGELDRRTVAQKRQIDELQARIRSGN